MSQATVFIGSSSEQLETARALKRCLDRHVKAKIWDEDVFELNESTFEGLVKAADEFDFAVFVFHPDDAAQIHNTKVRAVRDNVLFEFGLFTGSMGKGRVFWLIAHGSRPTHLPTDLAGITHLEYDRPMAGSSAELERALEKVCSKLGAEMTRLGPRTDRSMERLDDVRMLCAASSQFSEPEFAKDIANIQAHFPAGSIETAHGVKARHLLDYLSPGQRWDIVHLAMYVDSATGDLILPPVDGAAGSEARDRLPPGALENLIKDAKCRLVVVVTCDSLSLAARLARTTNVIAGHSKIDTRDALDWSDVFYRYLAQGCPMSEAFNRAQEATHSGLLLLAKHDFRLDLHRPERAKELLTRPTSISSGDQLPSRLPAARL
jgi:hypothetical protein